MKKNKLMFALTALVIASLACGVSINTGEGTQPPAPTPIVIIQQPPVQQAQPQVQPQPQVLNPAPQASVTPVPSPTATAPAPVTNPPTITGTEPLDCFPYPSFKFLYDDGIEMGVSVPVLAKAESKWSESGVDWYEVKWNGFKCWVYGGFVTKSGDFSQLKVDAVVVPWPPQPPYCDNDAKVAKIYIGLRVTLPYSQGSVRGYTKWYDGMYEFAGKRTRVTAITGLDVSGCMTVNVEIDGGQYPWRVRDLIIGKP